MKMKNDRYINYLSVFIWVISFLFLLPQQSISLDLSVLALDPADTLEEKQYYRIETIPIPNDVILEVGGMSFTDNGNLGVSTRRGEVWLIENPYSKKPIFKKFASGLHEPLGLTYKDNGFFLTQRGELSRIEDRNGDGKADIFKTVYSWPLSGNYHDYSYGPVILPNNDMLVTLNLSWIGYGESLVKWRGWLLKITPEGEMTPIATGLRSPAGFGVNQAGDIFYTENQGDWVGSGRMTHLEAGDFAGNPAGLKWANDPASPLKLTKEQVPNKGITMFEAAKFVPELKVPAIWFPHTLMGISTSGFLIDETAGKFGPFEGQMLVGDQGHSKIMRVFMENVNGVYQGACFPFREGFSSGLLRMVWGNDGSIFVGMTSRGWASTGKAPYGLQRLVWTGKTPFEIKEMKALADGFELVFTQPVNKSKAADPTTYKMTSFNYHYHSKYGSDIIERQNCHIAKAEVSDDGLKVKLEIHGLRKGYIHEIKADVLSSSGKSLLHNTGYYTLNDVPGGKILTSMPEMTAMENSGSVSSSKRITKVPETWTDGPEVSLELGTKPGLQYDTRTLEVKAGSKVALTFKNNDDMLHNIVITQTGDAMEKVANMAENLGLDGPDKSYVPDTDLVLFHSNILQPESEETIYFTAPTTPGEYRYVCTFPGHSYSMRGTLIVK
ncbi:MAG: plastocyanin/azurin family copper-binding protein [Bacteroidota bacterium]